jgi:U3 small nucleolar RNA-associated protein 12
VTSKYEQSHAFGTIYSGSSNIVWASRDVATGIDAGTGVVFIGANESVLSWDIKKGQQLGQWRDINASAEVTALANSPADESLFAVG